MRVRYVDGPISGEAEDWPTIQPDAKTDLILTVKRWMVHGVLKREADDFEADERLDILYGVVEMPDAHYLRGAEGRFVVRCPICRQTVVGDARLVGTDGAAKLPVHPGTEASQRLISPPRPDGACHWSETLIPVDWVAR